jgi:hypothetical protein
VNPNWLLNRRLESTILLVHLEDSATRLRRWCSDLRPLVGSAATLDRIYLAVLPSPVVLAPLEGPPEEASSELQDHQQSGSQSAF